jgi:hypothetical protein
MSVDQRAWDANAHAVLGRCLTTQPNPFGDQAALRRDIISINEESRPLPAGSCFLLIASGFAGLSKPPDYLCEV